MNVKLREYALNEMRKIDASGGDVGGGLLILNIILIRSLLVFARSEKKNSTANHESRR